jgi:hypothetical protein
MDSGVKKQQQESENFKGLESDDDGHCDEVHFELLVL